MKDVLLIADLHGQFGKIDSFLELNPEAVFIAGDLTNMGPVDAVDDVLSRIDVPCFAVPGNCDPKEILDTLEHSDAVCLHGSQMNLGKMSLVGVGGSNPTPFNTPFELTDKQIDDLLTAATAKMEKAVHNILISHAPPYDTLDLIKGEHVGSQSVRRHIKNFDLVCCAHIHEQRGVKDVDGVKIVNPGAAMDGYCAMLHFGNEAKDIKVELLTV
ncbi:MAG TPA: metallophosphoesterase [Methanoregula sp.]|nr:metallophosphoesterase [Methanoregula sp.]